MSPEEVPKDVQAMFKGLPLVLFLLRLGVFVVMFMWTLDKFVRPMHAAKVYENFYFIRGLGTEVAYGIGILELLLLFGFLTGVRKRFTYGAVFLLHAISTFSAYKQYLSPFEGANLLFYAAWPMLAACFALYHLRDLDTLWVFGKR